MRAIHCRLRVPALIGWVSVWVLVSCGRAFGISYTFESFQYPGTHISFASGINNFGQIVGFTGEVLGVDAAGAGFLRQGPDYTLLLFYGMYSGAYGINNHGIVVGTGLGGSFLYDSNKGTYDWFKGDGAQGINDLGQVVGTSTKGAWFYDGSTFQTISYPGAASTRAEGLNNKGQIVGSYGSGWSSRGFLYEDGIFHSIWVPGSNSTEALGINNFGQIVGSYTDAHGRHGFLVRNGFFTRFNVPEAINPEDYVTVGASINDYGVIAGWWQGWEGGRIVAFVATPTPEPGSLGLLGMGIAALVSRLYRNKRG